ncbi:tRNA lysidine(34) synthetase TilS [bacterium (Candidatus Torokbacteria) CG09_land_8_20_14_0_10_42_11]|nr:MAG: tRNA lysidine(34) synthetase TilS [bacterium (Candidatus Torokbacteria) CG09_land_8_20_14_0_10_42_11]
MLDKVYQTIQENNLISPSDRVIVALSGGPDSVCLAHILCRLREKLGIKIILAHLNHNLRGKEAEKDAKFVKKFAADFILPLECKKLMNKPANENSGRAMRYKFLKQTAKKYRAAKIAAAHHQDDQVETILSHFLRGAGLSGLSGMRYQNGKIIRPLLDCSREEILSYLEKNNLSYRVDQSNFSLKFTRNKIRLKLLPALKKEYNPQIRKNLLRLSKICRASQEYITEEARALISEHPSFLLLKTWQALPAILKREVLRQMIASGSGDCRDIYAVHLEEAVKMLEAQAGNKKKNLRRDLQIIKKNGKIWVKKTN